METELLKIKQIHLMKYRSITDISIILPQRLFFHVYVSFGFYLFYLAKKRKKVKYKSLHS